MIEIATPHVTEQQRVLNDYRSLIKEAERKSVQGTGLCDVLYEANVQQAYKQILANTPWADKKAVEEILRVAGYDPNWEPYVAKEGECSLTGIEIDCCPCGRHP